MADRRITQLNRRATIGSIEVALHTNLNPLGQIRKRGLGNQQRIGDQCLNPSRNRNRICRGSRRNQSRIADTVRIHLVCRTLKGDSCRSCRAKLYIEVPVSTQNDGGLRGSRSLRKGRQQDIVGVVDA